MKGEPNHVNRRRLVFALANQDLHVLSLTAAEENYTEVASFVIMAILMKDFASTSTRTKQISYNVVY